MTTTLYSKFGDFGASLNPAVENPTDPSNPLSYCLLPTFGTVFLHGASGDSALFNRTWSPNCQNFMSQYCAFSQTSDGQPWDKFCDAYSTLNVDTYWPNSAVIDINSMTLVYRYMKFKPTQGDQIFHNAAERRYLVFPGVKTHLEPFDPTVANSPLVTFYSDLPSSAKPIVRYIHHDTIDQDRLMQKMLDNPVPVLDVLTRIYVAWRMGEISIAGTQLETFLSTKCKKFDDIVHMLLKNLPEYLTQYPANSFSPPCEYKCPPPTGVHPYNTYYQDSSVTSENQYAPLACTVYNGYTTEFINKERN